MYPFTQTACFPLDHEVGRAVPHPTWLYTSFLTDFPVALLACCLLLDIKIRQTLHQCVSVAVTAPGVSISFRAARMGGHHRYRKVPIMMVLSSLALRLWWRMWVRWAMSVIAAALACSKLRNGCGDHDVSYRSVRSVYRDPYPVGLNPTMHSIDAAVHRLPDSQS